MKIPVPSLAPILTLFASTLVLAPAHADEGMWLVNAFPSKRVEAAYGFAPDRAWLKRVRLASVRLARGCSGSFVSGQGLVLTNHHCARRCIQQLSTDQANLAEKGFSAASVAEERRCPEMEVNQLVGIDDVTVRIRRATKGRRGGEFEAALRGEMNEIEKECSRSGKALRCDVVSLYQGSLFHLYRYRRFLDVRLVFAPEGAIAHFGGDPDNFNFPRYSMDFSFVRVYEDGRPAATPTYLRIAPQGAREKELTFVTGNPGRTSRLLTASQLSLQRDLAIPQYLFDLSELRGVLRQLSRRSDELRRQSRSLLLGIDNAVKALRSRHQALADPDFFGRKVAEERVLRERVARAEKLREAASAWESIAEAQARYRTFFFPYTALEKRIRLYGKLFGYARKLVRASAERPKPDRERLREFREAAMPSLKQVLFSTAPVYPEVEKALLRFSLRKVRERLGVDHAAVRRALGVESPDELAARAVQGTKLAEVAYRRALWSGGAKAIADSDDPMIALARRLEPFARAIRHRHENEVESVEKQSGDLIARARFALYGTDTYPDATFSFRISYGAVQGWREGERTVSPFTSFAGLYERATGRPPFQLPPSWQAAKGKLAQETPMNFVTSNDIIGGNSGSPLINRNGELVGLAFDGNLHSLGGAYRFEAQVNRCVAVHPAAILAALGTVYGATRLAGELTGKR